MKRAILIPFVLFFCIYANAQKNTQLADTSVLKKTEAILFIKEEVFDFGKIPQGKPVNHIFDIQNKGVSSLKLDNVQASCGCTTPEWDRNKEIFPGAVSSIKVGYNAASEGVFSKVITITYNESQTKQITIKGEVWKTPTASAPSNTEINELKD